jgi:sialate O-acetylesterase
VYIGDLWLLAGQSNMEGCGRISATARPAEPVPQVRCLTMARRWELAREPLHLRAESPDAVHNVNGNAGRSRPLSAKAGARLRDQATCGAGLGLHFGRLMYERSGVPQGLIATAHGGTTMQQWDPALRGLGGGSLYGSMMLSLRAAGQPLAGVLWYQGESEALPALARAYASTMKRFVAAVRRDTSQPDLPWIMVQIGRFIRGASFDHKAWPNAAAWNEVQERQRLLPRSVNHCAVVPAVDLELDDCAHIGTDAFPILARRLADRAVGFVSGGRCAGGEISPASVRYRKVGPKDHLIHIDLAGVQGDLQSVGPVRGFTLLSGDGRVLTAIHRVRISPAAGANSLGGALKRVTLSLTDPLPPRSRLAYGQGLDPLCNLTDSRGMAVPVFGPLPIVGIQRQTEWVVRKANRHALKEEPQLSASGART